MSRQRAFTLLMEPGSRQHRRKSANSSKKSSFIRVRRPILQTQFSNIEEESELFVYLWIHCVKDMSDITFESRELFFPADKRVFFGQRFDSSTETCSLSSLRKEDSSPISKIDFECSFLPQEHAQLWFDEEQKVLCTGFPGPSAHQPLNVDEVRVHPCGSDTNYESIQRPSLAKDPSELGKRINIHSGDIVTLLTGKDSVTFRLYYRTGDESYKETWSNIGAKTESLNSQIDRLLQLESPSEPSKELEEPRQQGSPLKTLLVFLLPAIIFTLLFVLFGETNRKLVTF